MNREFHNRIVAQNRKAGYDYFIKDVMEAGVQLAGTEVKSVRQGNVSIKDSYAGIKNGELFVYGMHINPYEKGNISNKDADRDRKLLLHRKEINRLIGLVKREGMSLIPLKVYTKGRVIKVEIGVCKGKKLYDKRQSIAEKAHRREMERKFKESF